MYSSFTGLPSPPLPVAGTAPPWPGGVVAAGTILVGQPGIVYSCRLGIDDGSGPCACGKPGDNPCVLAAPCWGDLCDVSPGAIASNTTYLVRIWYLLVGRPPLFISPHIFPHNTFPYLLHVQRPAGLASPAARPAPSYVRMHEPLVSIFSRDRPSLRLYPLPTGLPFDGLSRREVRWRYHRAASRHNCRAVYLPAALYPSPGVCRPPGSTAALEP